MTTAAHQSSEAPAFPRAKIRRIVQGILPKGQSFRMQTEDSGIDRKRVVRIVTPAWKSLSNPERISKVLKAMQGQLSPAEQNRIFRLSVLTERQFRDIVADPVSRPASLPPKRKLARKPKRAVAR